jgi:hypothetical protein
VEAPYVTIGQIALVGFFFYFAITPILGELEARLIQNSNVCEDLSPCNAYKPHDHTDSLN